MADLSSGDDKLVSSARRDMEGVGEEEVDIERIEKVYE
jgi:hypothetical protein